MNTFLGLLSCPTKKELTSVCKSAKIESNDFVDFIIFCKAGLCHLDHIMTYHDYVPEHLEPTEEDYGVLERHSPEEIATPKAQKALTRLFKSHGQRKYKIGHLFYERDAGQIPKEWHFVFFEVSELKDEGNHWEAGAHVHVVNYLWPNLNVIDVWRDFAENKSFPKTKLHVRFNEKEKRKA